MLKYQPLVPMPASRRAGVPEPIEERAGGLVEQNERVLFRTDSGVENTFSHCPYDGWLPGEGCLEKGPAHFPPH